MHTNSSINEGSQAPDTAQIGPMIDLCEQWALLRPLLKCNTKQMRCFSVKQTQELSHIPPQPHCQEEHLSGRSLLPIPKILLLNSWFSISIPIFCFQTWRFQHILLPTIPYDLFHVQKCMAHRQDRASTFLHWLWVPVKSLTELASNGAGIHWPVEIN